VKWKRKLGEHGGEEERLLRRTLDQKAGMALKGRLSFKGREE